MSLLLLSFSSIAQTVKNNNLKPSPLFTKGYYTIGNHAEKLKPVTLPSPDTTVNQEASKGFYSIPSNDTMQRRKSVWYNKRSVKPTFSKGYYTIGAGTEPSPSH